MVLFHLLDHPRAKVDVMVEGLGLGLSYAAGVDGPRQVQKDPLDYANFDSHDEEEDGLLLGAGYLCQPIEALIDDLALEVRRIGGRQVDGHVERRVEVFEIVKSLDWIQGRGSIS